MYFLLKYSEYYVDNRYLVRGTCTVRGSVQARHTVADATPVRQGCHRKISVLVKGHPVLVWLAGVNSN
jgi:hypothetical protein